MCSDSIINRTAFTPGWDKGKAKASRQVLHNLHSPSLGSIAMATPTEVSGKRTTAWRVIWDFLFLYY